MSTTSSRYHRIPKHPAVNCLPARAQVLLGVLYHRLDSQDVPLNLKHKTLAEDLGCSVGTVQRHMRVLREAGIIRATKGRRASTYKIQPPDQWGDQ